MLERELNRRTFLLSTVASGAVLIRPLGSLAQDATPAPEAAAPSLPTGCEVVATGLFNPRGISFGPDGTLYIAESGAGGSDADFATPGAGTPAAAEPAATHGNTGRVSILSPDGTQSVLIDGLTSYNFGTEVVGPSGVVVAADGTVYVAVGGPGPNTAAFPPAGNADWLVSFDPASGTVTPLADIGTYERENNPDPYAIDSNLGGLAIGADGLIYVADAGGNAVYTYDPASGDLKVLAVIPGIPTPDNTPNPLRGGAAEADPVPTGVAAAPDGGVYVGLLSGASLWAVPGATKVIHIAPDGTITDALTGLNLVVGVAVGSDGTIYATELSTNFFADPPAAGQVASGAMGGAGTPTIAGLPLPYGVAVAENGDIYVAINSSAPSSAGAVGMVVRCTADSMGGSASPVAEAASSPIAADFTIDLVDIAFDPSDLTIPADTDVTIALVNKGVATHDFNIDKLDLESGYIAPGTTKVITINAPAGSYDFYCNIPGHSAAGMVGVLTVS